jgi:hypothetical protein
MTMETTSKKQLWLSWNKAINRMYGMKIRVEKRRSQKERRKKLIRRKTVSTIEQGTLEVNLFVWILCSGLNLGQRGRDLASAHGQVGERGRGRQEHNDDRQARTNLENTSRSANHQRVVIEPAIISANSTSQMVTCKIFFLLMWKILV